MTIAGRALSVTLLGALAFTLTGAGVPGVDLTVAIDHLRSDRGDLLICVTADERHFPDCSGDARARHVVAPADAAGAIVIGDLAPGRYAVSVIHDENANGRLDKRLMIPREGFGFSRNPAIRFGPPDFDEVRVMIAPGESRQAIRMKYLL